MFPLVSAELPTQAAPSVHSKRSAVRRQSNRDFHLRRVLDSLQSAVDRLPEASIEPAAAAGMSVLRLVACQVGLERTAFEQPHNVAAGCSKPAAVVAVRE